MPMSVNGILSHLWFRLCNFRPFYFRERERDNKVNDERERGVERSLKWVCSKVSYMYIYRRLSACWSV